MQIREINVMTGEETVRDMTPEEIAALPPPEPPPVPPLTFPQLLFGLLSESWITEAEANAWLVDRALPTSVETLLATLPAEQQFLARARALQPTQIIRTDPLVESLGTAQGKTSEELDNFFRTYAGV